MRVWFIRAMAAALILPLAACVEPPAASAPPGYAIGADGRAWRAPPPRSRFGYGGPVYVPPIDTPRGYTPRGYYPPGYYPPSYYPPSYYPPSRRPSFWGPGWSDRRRRDDDDDRRKPEKGRDEPDRRPVVDAGGEPPRPDRPEPQRPKPSRKKPLIEPRSASAADESRGDRESAESW